MTLLTLITSLHARPFRPLPMLFPPLLAFSSYLTLAGFKIDGAGMTAAWSGMYVLLEWRRWQKSSSLGRPRLRLPDLRGVVRFGATTLAVVNCMAGVWVYATGDRVKEEKERREENRWGVYKD